MTKSRSRRVVEYCVFSGVPSWHQRRAGNLAAGAMCFNTKREAVKFLRRIERLRPDEPATIRAMPKSGMGGHLGITVGAEERSSVGEFIWRVRKEMKLRGISMHTAVQRVRMKDRRLAAEVLDRVGAWPSSEPEIALLQRAR